MATANTKSAAITDADATQPRVMSDPWNYRSGVMSAVGTIEVAAADDNGSVYRFCRIPSSARIDSVHVMSDAITAGTAFDVGLYKTAADGGAAVDADFFAADLDLSAGNTVPVEVTFGNALDISKIEQRVWEVLGLSADPRIDYDVCLTGDTVGTAAGTISVRVRFVV